jgi:membrane-associated phospholipid phosphatase
MNPSLSGASYEPQTTKEKRIEKAGHILQVLIPATGYATTYILGDKAGRGQFHKSFLTSLAITYALKYSIYKARPENNGNQSFPSGHTSAAFQGATFIHIRYGWKYGLSAYICAAFVGYSRDEGDMHDWVDIPAGAVIGFSSSYYFTKPYKDVVITPVVNKDFYGLSMSFKW